MLFAPRTWFGAPLDPAAIAKCKGKRRTDDLLAVAITRLGIVSNRLSAVERMRGEQPLACQDGLLGGARLRRGGERREPGLVKGKA